MSPVLSKVSEETNEKFDGGTEVFGMEASDEALVLVVEAMDTEADPLGRGVDKHWCKRKQELFLE